MILHREEIMKTKRFFAALLISTSLCSAVAVPTITSFAGSVYDKDLFTYTQKEEGSYANFYAYPSSTYITSTKSGYESSYKSADYIQYGQTGNSYYEIGSEVASGTAETLGTSSLAVTSAVALRTQTAEIHGTSDEGSKVMERFAYNIYKYKLYSPEFIPAPNNYDELT